MKICTQLSNEYNKLMLSTSKGKLVSSGKNIKPVFTFISNEICNCLSAAAFIITRCSSV